MQNMSGWDKLWGIQSEYHQGLQGSVDVIHLEGEVTSLSWPKKLPVSCFTLQTMSTNNNK